MRRRSYEISTYKAFGSRKGNYKALFQTVIGMGCTTPLSKLNGEQKQQIQELAQKGYVNLSKKSFMFVMPETSGDSN